MKDARWIRTAIVALAGAALTLALSASAEAAPPPNDNYGSATQFEPTPGTVLGTNVDATRQSGETGAPISASMATSPTPSVPASSRARHLGSR